MATAEVQVAREGVTAPRLVFFTSSVSGHARRVEGFLAQVVDEHARPDLVERFKVVVIPTLVVVDDRSERARLDSPRGCRDIEQLLAPWLH